jgi:GNAT superfamily N-acetyltransferase
LLEALRRPADAGVAATHARSIHARSMTWTIRQPAAADAAAIAALFGRSRLSAMPWLPVLHTPDEDVAFFTDEVATSLGWVAVDGVSLLGFALGRDGWLNHLYVDPRHQGRGVGSALLAQAVEAMPDGIQLWAFERNVRARAFYAGRGFVEAERTDGTANQEREPDVRMVRASSDAEPVLVRYASPDDAEGIARVHTTSWQEGYRGLLPQDFLDLLDWRARRDWWRAELEAPSNPGRRVVVAARGGRIVGFAAIGPARDDDLRAESPPWFELYAIYVSPDHWREGVGASLLAAGRQTVPDGVDRWALWVLRDNDRARAFYGEYGFEPDGATRVEEIGGAQAHEVRYRGTR